MCRTSADAAALRMVLQSRFDTGERCVVERAFTSQAGIHRFRTRYVPVNAIRFVRVGTLRSMNVF